MADSDTGDDIAMGNPLGTASEGRPQTAVELESDEDWKNRVKAEDAALDQQFREKGKEKSSATASESADQTQAARPKSSQAPPELPPASFPALINMLSTQAMVALGLIPNPATQKAECELPLARYFIDLIGVLEEKTAGKLTSEEASFLDETLHTLRMAFVKRSKPTD